MRNLTVTAEVDLVTESCCQCSMTFAMTAAFNQIRRKDHDWFYCPAGHPQRYTGETNEEKLKRELNRAKQNNAYLEEQTLQERRARELAERQRAAARGQVTKLKKHVVAGKCPCCRRNFSALSEHMRKQHPQFMAEAIAGDEIKEAART